jgi:hypothetical protein
MCPLVCEWELGLSEQWPMNGGRLFSYRGVAVRREKGTRHDFSFYVNSRRLIDSLSKAQDFLTPQAS